MRKEKNEKVVLAMGDRWWDVAHLGRVLPMKRSYKTLIKYKLSSVKLFGHVTGTTNNSALHDDRPPHSLLPLP
jgi:hypothetical protein